MAPTIVRGIVARLSARTPDDAGSIYAKGPLVARAVLLARDTASTPTTVTGITSPKAINNNGMFALFGILGAAICVMMIWFFFWAKNGGFYFKKNDWDEYKSTVLRRRGPNGTLLSNATPSTNLGGGSVYKDVDDGSTEDATTVVTAATGTTGITGITGGVSDILGREKRRKKREQREREKERRREEKSNEKARKAQDKSKSRSSRKVNEEGVLIDEAAEAEAELYLREYRHEKAARVGGINKTSDSSNWDGSTNPSGSSAAPTESTVTSDLMSNRERTPTSTPTKKTNANGGGIRKVYSTADRNAAREQERIRAEARRLQERGQRASHSYSTSGGGGGGRRDFSWQHGEDASTPLRQIDETASSRIDDDGRSHVPGAWTDSGVAESDIGTKAYRHHIPGLSTNSDYSGGGGATEAQDYAYAEEKRKKRQQRSPAYRRD